MKKAITFITLPIWFFPALLFSVVMMGYCLLFDRERLEIEGKMS